MVQLAQIAIFFTLALSGFAEAKSCKKGGIYCGQYLLKKGDYITKIITNLKANNMDTDDTAINESLWSCLEHGDIAYLEMCNAGCIGGDKKDDYCLADDKKRDEAVSWEAISWNA